MRKENKIVDIPLALIEPDENQPRKNFDSFKLNNLKKSITKHGIMNPLMIEKQGGLYILVDGERRYRVAKELKLKTVPCIVMEAQSDVDRLVQQFHIQEQHEGWSSLEKADAVGKLATALEITVREVAELLNLPEKTMGTYVAFSKLLAKKEFVKQEISLDVAHKIIALRIFVRNYFSKNVPDDEFTKDDEYDLEIAVISRIKDGSLQNRNEILKLQDAIRTDPKIVRKFIKDPSITIEGLFKSSGAEAAQYYRRIFAVIPQFIFNWKHLKTKSKSIKPIFESDIRAEMHKGYVKSAIEALEELADEIR